MIRNVLSTFLLALIGALISYVVVAYVDIDSASMILGAFVVFGVLIFVRSFLRASS
ncbi:hypothetical protein [Haladaptatus caseinilyticus]|uniref:hypothetical protein n=1 Tax=Haladaptatus caseinilyticus TaxID=2993314 RepID=UPI00224BA0B5|nr:hypothetical protein [Haladaptatus caseinilyticus]